MPLREPTRRAEPHPTRLERNRIATVALLILCGFATACSEAPEPSEHTRRPNLLLITIDTLRADRLACYGGKSGAGLGLCEIFRTGARFRWAFSTAPATAPSLASILTSQYPRDHGVNQFLDTRLADSAVSVAELLAAADYETAAFVANPVIQKPRNLQQGFDVYDDRMTRRELNRPGMIEREAAEVTDQALAWIRAADAPWFVWIHYQDPHGPYQSPDAVDVRDAAGAERLVVLDDMSGLGGIPAYQQIAGIASLESYEWRYAQEIRYVDKQITRLVGEVDRTGSPPSIVLTADHGEAFGEDDFYLAHGHSVALEQIRVPLLWRPASRETLQGVSDREVQHTASTLDVAPTLLAEAGVEAPAGFLGRPLLEVAIGAESVRNRTLFAEHRLRIAAIREAHYFGRDRQPFAEPIPDLVTGGILPPLPPRNAQLLTSGRWSDYASTHEQRDELERDVADFLAIARRQRDESDPSSTTSEIDPLTREALKALGYLR